MKYSKLTEEINWEQLSEEQTLSCEGQITIEDCKIT